MATVIPPFMTRSVPLVFIAQRLNKTIQKRYQRGDMLLNGRGTGANFPASAKDLLRAAEQGHAGAQFAIAGLYEEGKGLERLLDSALYWLQASAMQDFAQSFFPLGINLLAQADNDIKTRYSFVMDYKGCG